jgi:hypothetical protein
MLIYKGKEYKTRKELVAEIGKATFNKLLKINDTDLIIMDCHENDNKQFKERNK